MTTPYDAFLDSPTPSPSPYVATLRIADTDLPDAPADVPLTVVVTGGAGQVAGPVGLCVRRGLSLVVVESTLRDLDDPAGNARRVVAAADAAGLPDGSRLHVGVTGPPTPSWLAAADEVAAYEGGLSLDLDSPGIQEWIDAALDRELPFSLRGGTLEAAVDALHVTARLWGDPDDLAAARRWCRSWACDDLDASAGHLQARATASG